MRLLLAVMLSFGALSGAQAIEPSEILDDPALEQRARGLSKELRCPVCQNQSLDDSDADIAKDLRRIVRERLVEGDTDAEVKDFLVARYGDYVLLEPPVKPQTWPLWFGPLAILGVGGLAVWQVVRRGRRRFSAAGGGGLAEDDLDDPEAAEGGAGRPAAGRQTDGDRSSA